MDAPLAGCRIVSTRPAAQAASLHAALTALGAEVIAFPVIAIEATDPAPLAALDLSRYALAFFVSANAVDQALAVRPRAHWPAALRVATVGPGSARALTEAGFDEVVAPASGFDSEAVLALPEFAANAVAGRRVLVLRGEGGRELLAETLEQRGAQVDQIGCYRRLPAPLDAASLVARFDAEGLDALIFTASEGVRFFLTILGQDGPRLLRDCTTLAPHPRIAACLREAGARRVKLTGPGDAGLIEGLRALLREAAPATPPGQKPGLIG
ncbi:MAG: uroporphyrinogen-III synthase [Candidatus Dactylopiibacterium sp.]|nr:uroporphyrinogen-III synthase [Candidatus Dactylopiibacterium sp.]